MGTPAFAVPTLHVLHEDRHNVLAVVTKPDRPKGRGRHLVPSPVKEAAGRIGYPILQPARVKDPDFLDKIIALDPDLFVVVAYGHILPGSVLAIPRLGAINVHASLLPKYRGPAPIQWAILNQEKETGVTTMWLDEGMDTGQILMTAKVSITPQETTESLYHRLAHAGAQLLLDTLEKLKSEPLLGSPQDHAKATYAPFLKKEDGRIDWSKDAKSLEAFVRGMNPWPGTFTFLLDKRLKVLRAHAIEKKVGAAPGTVLEAFPGELHVATGKGILSLKEVQPASGRRLSVEDFLRGNPVEPGTVLG
jgi:methionyl-tRNA formyltransferase